MPTAPLPSLVARRRAHSRKRHLTGRLGEQPVDVRGVVRADASTEEAARPAGGMQSRGVGALRILMQHGDAWRTRAPHAQATAHPARTLVPSVAGAITSGPEQAPYRRSWQPRTFATWRGRRGGRRGTASTYDASAFRREQRRRLSAILKGRGGSLRKASTSSGRSRGGHGGHCGESNTLSCGTTRKSGVSALGAHSARTPKEADQLLKHNVGLVGVFLDRLAQREIVVATTHRAPATIEARPPRASCSVCSSAISAIAAIGRASWHAERPCVAWGDPWATPTYMAAPVGLRGEGARAAGTATVSQPRAARAEMASSSAGTPMSPPPMSPPPPSRPRSVPKFSSALIILLPIQRALWCFSRQRRRQRARPGVPRVHGVGAMVGLAHMWLSLQAQVLAWSGRGHRTRHLAGHRVACWCCVPICGVCRISGDGRMSLRIHAAAEASLPHGRCALWPQPPSTPSRRTRRLGGVEQLVGAGTLAPRRVPREQIDLVAAPRPSNHRGGGAPAANTPRTRPAARRCPPPGARSPSPSTTRAAGPPPARPPPSARTISRAWACDASRASRGHVAAVKPSSRVHGRGARRGGGTARSSTVEPTGGQRSRRGTGSCPDRWARGPGA